MFRRALIIFLVMTLPAFGHEFWILPQSYSIGADQKITAQLRIGQNFEGAIQRFFPGQTARFEIGFDGKVVKADPRMGDDPALQMMPLGDGLLVIVHETTDSTLTYRDGTKFVNFVTHKGAAELAGQHNSRGLPDDGFKEKYRRFAKSLIAAGNGEGQDYATGMRAEVVALANPYTDDLTVGLPVQVLYQGLPREGAFVEVFARQETGEVSVSSHRAGEDGIVLLPVQSGVEFLVDATLILPLQNEDPSLGPVWESLWASLTFMVPKR